MVEVVGLIVLMLVFVVGDADDAKVGVTMVYAVTVTWIVLVRFPVVGTGACTVV